MIYIHELLQNPFFWYLVTLMMTGKFIKRHMNFERNMRIVDSVLRYLVIRYEGELPAKREMPQRPAPVREAEAPAAPVEAPVAAEVAPAEPVDDERPVSEAE